MRAVQPEGKKGSLKWIQKAVAKKAAELENPIVQAIGGDHDLIWKSPVSSDDYAEYRDGSFLDVLELGFLRGELKEFWPARGPQWDALGLTSKGDVILVEAKAHIREMCSPPTQANGESRRKIEAAFDALEKGLGASENRADWTQHFYQIANRLAHLDFLRQRKVKAWLVFANFIGDGEMNGPTSAEAWKSAEMVINSVMGIPKRNRLSRYIIHAYPDVSQLA